MEFLGKLNKLLFFVMFMLLMSCIEGNCDDARNDMLDVECLQIFERLPTFESYNMKSEGIHLVTGEKCICEDRWLNNYKDLLEKGDTIIKRRGELSFSIHKKDTIIEIKWECEGKVYE